MSCPTTAVVVVLAVVVTAVVKEVGVAVTDPVPVPFMDLFRFIFVMVCVVTVGEVVPGVAVQSCVGELDERAGVTEVSEVELVNTASVFISKVWFLSSWFAWSCAAILSRAPSALVLLAREKEVPLLEGEVVLCVASSSSEPSREGTLVIPVVLTSREGTFWGGELLTRTELALELHTDIQGLWHV